MAEPVAAQVAALRADLAELGGMVARIGKERAAGLKSAAGATAADGYAKGEEAIDVVLAELQSLEDEVAEADAPPALRLAGAGDARRASCSASCSGAEGGAPLRDGVAGRGGAHPQRRAPRRRCARR